MANVIDPDADILPGLKAREERALKVLMNRRLNSVHALSTRLLGDPILAEDVCQHVFLKLWDEVPNWTPGKAKLMTWLCRVATNRCLDILRKKGPIYTDILPEIVNPEDGVADKLIENETQIRVRNVVDLLPERQRTAIILCYFEELSQKEAAEMLEISEKAYESLLSRARKTLKKSLVFPMVEKTKALS
ncbi:MAG: sigma-70 family RNA polymerase sigma factor [Maricaulaceae bacterium]